MKQNDKDITPCGLNIKAVSRLSGVSAFTIRAWEKRYGALQPLRAPNGRRVYQAADVERLKLLAVLVHSGQTIGSVARAGTPELKKLAGDLGGAWVASSRPSFLKVIKSSTVSPAQVLEATFEALKKFDLSAVDECIRAAQAVLNVEQWVLKVLSPLLQEVGVAVETGRLTIAQEHALSALLRGRLYEVFCSIQDSWSVRERPPETRKMIMACFEGDQHEFGIYLSALLCASRGHEVFYLGPNLPPLEIARAAEAVRANVVVVSMTPTPPEYLREPWLVSLERLDKKLAPECEIWMGGSAPLDFKDIEFERGFRYFPTLKSILSV